MIKKVLFIGVCIFAFASCTTVKPLYSSYSSEDITYQYSKKSTEELQVKVLEQYQKMIDKQKGAKRDCSSWTVCRVRIYAISYWKERGRIVFFEGRNKGLSGIRNIYFKNH